MKEKKSSKKSSAFGSDNSFKTKYANFFSDGRRQIAFQLERTENNESWMRFSSMYLGDGFKQQITLGQNIKIAFVFEDETIQIIDFATNPIVESGNTNFNYNAIKLTDEILELFQTKTLTDVQIKNPFNTLNDGKVISESVDNKQSERINQICACYSSKISK